MLSRISAARSISIVDGEKEVRHRADRRDESLGDRLANFGCWLVAISGSSREQPLVD